MRSYRVALFAGWLLVSSLAVAGFAAFRAEAPPPGTASEVPPVVMPADVGRTAGAVAAMTFSLLPDGARAGAPGDFSGDLAALVGESATEDAAIGSAPTSSSSAGVVDRSKFYDESQVRALIQQFFDADDVNRAIRIAWCESSFNPTSVNPVTGAAGLFQHDPATWADRSAAAGFPGAGILEPEANVAVAAWMLYELPGGWAQWECQA